MCRESAQKAKWLAMVWDHLGAGEKQFGINFVLPQAARYMTGPDWSHSNAVRSVFRKPTKVY